MITVNSQIQLAEWEVEWSAIRAQGAGGQNVNKVSSAIHLRFDIHRSSLPSVYKERLLNYSDSRITRDGVIIIKAQQFRTQEKNRDDAEQRLCELIRRAIHVDKKRRATKPSYSSVKRRLESKTKRAKIKSARGKVSID